MAMSDLESALEALIPAVGKAVVEEAKRELQELSDDSEDPVKGLVFDLMTEAVKEFGGKGVKVAESEITKLLNGQKADLNWASPRNASGALALLQNAERDRKKKAKEALKKFGDAVGRVGIVIIKAAILGAIGV
jgi:hypothetical protein